MTERDQRSNYWLKIHAQNIAGRVVALVTGGGKWIEGKSDYWNISHGRTHDYQAPSPQATPPPAPKPSPTAGPAWPAGAIPGRVKHDVEYYFDAQGRGVSRIVAQGMLNADGNAPNGLPETVKALDSDWIPLSKQWQFYWFNLLSMVAAAHGFRDSVVNLFRVISRSIAFKTNQHGAESGYANFVTGQNLDAKPMATEVIWTGGAYLAILNGGQLYQSRGKPAYKAAVLNVTKAVPAAEFLNQQTWYCYFATTVRKDGSVIPLTGGLDIPTPAVGEKDWYYIEAARVELWQIATDASPAFMNPYYVPDPTH